jgi:hypothetical protein
VSQDGHEVGALADEAAKLLGALGDWARDQHLATGAPECTYCPLCRTVHALRHTSPEVRAHLATAATSLVQAVSGLLATAVPEDRARSGVEHIDLDDGPDGWPEDTGTHTDPHIDPEEGDR